MESESKKMHEGAPPAPRPIEETDPEIAEFFKRLVDYQCARKKEGKLSRFDVNRFIYQGIGRNDPCPCESKKEDGTPKKFKKCCMIDINEG